MREDDENNFGYGYFLMLFSIGSLIVLIRFSISV